MFRMCAVRCLGGKGDIFMIMFGEFSIARGLIYHHFDLTH